jgi:two-component system, chemotaxis family, CheB/CheR fusion protein
MKPVLTEQEPYIVAIGASAGGLESIHDFFDNMPVNGNLAFVIIQHLSSDYKSLLVELVSKHTNMQVLEAQHNVEVKKHCVYVIPNNKLLTIENGRLMLSQKVLDKSPNTAIDIFLKSLAKDQGEKAIAVILSGTGTDGTKGSHAIQENGGLVIVQDPISAKFDGMPNSVIAAGYAEYILSPELIPEEIFAYTNESPVRSSRNGKPDEKALPEVLSLIESHCGHDFHNYKAPTILRRISKRMGQLGKKNFSEYLDTLRSTPEECSILGKEFLIGVTKFFRDQAAFDILREEVLPIVFRSKQNGDVLKVWVTACSTGQEAYSIAILLDEYIHRHELELEIKIFATDVDADAIEYAAKGVYPVAAASELDPFLVKKYFTLHNGQLTIVPQIRQQIVFARHNILKDPPFIKNDIITCRNMLIYMNQLLQRKVFATLEFSLNTGGYLFLGPSEIPASIKNNLDEVNGKWKIFRKMKDINPYQGERFTSGYTIRNPREAKQDYGTKDRQKTNVLAEDLQSILTDQFGFAAIYIDDNYEIKDAVGDFRRYLSLPDRIASLNILKMVNTDLSVALNTAIRKVKKENQKVTLQHVRIKEGNTEKFINLFVKPAKSDPYITIVFGESHEITFNKTSPEFTVQHSESVSYITELEDELKEAKLNLQMAVESLETTNEELQSSNEELLSANEELQSSNEELQSLNEELHTLNTEHQLRIRELIELNDDLDNYFRSTEIGQVFVDKDMRIRKFNTAAVQMVNLIESDIGRPIEHISTNIKQENLITDIKKVIQTNTIIEKEVRLSNQRISLMRILPYVRQDNNIDGAVITFIDITNFTELNSIIKGVFNASTNSIMALKSLRNDKKEILDFEWMAANHATDTFLGLKNNTYIGQTVKKCCPTLMQNGFFEKCVAVVDTDKSLHTEMLFVVNGQEEWFEVVATKMMDGLVLTLTNINEKKLAEQKIRNNYNELLKAKANLKQLNASLEQKVSERTRDLATSEERFRLIADTTSDVVWDWNLVNSQIWWSDSITKVFGYETVENISSTDFWLNNIHPDDKDRVEKSKNNAINKSIAHWEEQYRFRKSDGSYAVIHDKGAVIKDETSMPYRMVGAMTDVTHVERTELKLKQKNEELQSLFEEFKFVTDFMPQMVWATRPDGYHDFYNKGWYDFTGLDYESTKNEGWSLILHPDDFERTWQIWKHSLETGEVYETEYRMRRYDGVYRWFLARALPMRDETGKIIKWFGTCTDIHDQKEMSDILEQKVEERTRELQRTNAELEVTNAELFQFASVASHDLKEPLRKIHMFSTLIKDRYLKNDDGGASDYMDRIISSSARMTKLINDLLSYSRLSIKSLFEPTDLNSVVNEVVADLELSIHEKQAVVQVEPLPVIDAVPGQIRQVFQNIISNALKFSSEANQPHILVKAEVAPGHSLDSSIASDDDYCCISIQDNGIGFDEQHAAKIFTIFQRLHGREKYEGTGIGLAITKKIIERHNGFVYAKSKPGEGSAFNFILPLKQHVVSTATEGLSN